MQRFGYMGERRAEKPNRDEEEPTPRQQQGSSYGRQACRDKERKGAGVPGPMPGPSGRVWKRERQGSSGGLGATQGLGHSGAAEEAGWGEGGTA